MNIFVNSFKSIFCFLAQGGFSFGNIDNGFDKASVFISGGDAEESYSIIFFVEDDGGRDFIDSILFRFFLVSLEVIDVKFYLIREGADFLQELSCFFAVETLLSFQMLGNNETTRFLSKEDERDRILKLFAKFFLGSFNDIFIQDFHLFTPLNGCRFILNSWL